MSIVNPTCRISSTVLGLGINGKVVECFSNDGEKCALKVSCNEKRALDVGLNGKCALNTSV